MVHVQEFNIDKLQMVEVEKKKIRAEYDRKDKLVELRKKMYAHPKANLSFLITNCVYMHS